MAFHCPGNHRVFVTIWRTDIYRLSDLFSDKTKRSPYHCDHYVHIGVNFDFLHLRFHHLEIVKNLLNQMSTISSI